MGGFNFGAFAGGLAQGIQKGRELALKQKQLEQDRIKQEQENNAKIQERIDKNKKDASKAVKDSSEKVTEATEALYDSKTDTIEGKVNIHNAKLREAQSLVDGYGTPINKPELAVFEYDNTKYVVSADMVDEMKDRAVTGSIKIQPKTGLIEYMDNENDGWYSTGGKAINENVYMKAKEEDTKYQTRTLYKDGKEVKVYSQSEYDKYINDGFTPVKTEKESKELNKGQAVARTIELRQKETLTEKEKTELKTLEEGYDITPKNQTEFQVLQSAYQKALDNGETTASNVFAYQAELDSMAESAPIESAMKYGTKFASDVSTFDSNLAYKAQAAYRKKPDTKTEEILAGSSEIVRQGDALIDDIKQQMKDPNYEPNQYLSWWNNVTTKYLPDIMNMDTKEEKLAYIDNLVIEGKIDKIIADRLRAVSGTAASEKEFARTLKYVADNIFTSKEVRFAKIKSFVDDERIKATKAAKKIARQGGVITAAEFLAPDLLETKKTKKTKTSWKDYQ